MNLDSTNYHTVTEYNASKQIVKVHRFSGKSMFGIHCKTIYISDEGYLFNTKNFILTNVSTDDHIKHYNAIPLDSSKVDCKNKKPVISCCAAEHNPNTPPSGTTPDKCKNYYTFNAICMPGPGGDLCICEEDPHNKCINNNS